MKKYIFIIILSTIYALSAYCSKTDSCKLIFYRDTKLFMASKYDFRIYTNDTFLTRLENNTYFTYNCTPGTYVFKVGKKNDKGIHLNAEGGKTYYLKFLLVYNGGVFMKFSHVLTVVDSVSAVSEINSLKMTECMNTKFTYIKYHNRLGLSVGYGFGFNYNPIFKLSDGSHSDISFGGGSVIGLKYGYEINKNFDISFNFNYKVSTDLPGMKNAVATFKRTVVSVTPALIIPIKKGEDFSIKIGGGYDYYTYSEFKIDASYYTNGIKDIWKYKNTSGYHACASLEMYYSKHFCYDFTIKYYKVFYLFSSSSSYYPASDNGLYKPDGDGLDIIIGFNYIF